LNRWLIFLVLLGAFAGARGQLMDSLHDVFSNKYSIDARLESRNSFITNRLISVTGVRLGVAFQRKLRIGGGLSWLKTEVPSAVTDAENPVRYLKFAYLCYYVDFVFYKNKRWQLSVPIQAGTGISWFQEEMTYQWKTRYPKYFMLLYEPGITAQFKIFKWIGIGSDIAYRFALVPHKRTEQQLNSPTYSFKLLFWADQLYYEFFPESRWTKRYGPAYW
jgi:hypothetical protein